MEGHEALPEGCRVALVHDWLTGMRGGERVLEQFCRLFPKADLHTLIYNREAVSSTIRSMRVVESPFGRLPGARQAYRSLLPVLPRFAERLPTGGYDLVLSLSHCVAKAAPRPRHGMHLSYVFSPMRYVWDHFDDYLSTNPIKNVAMRLFRRPLQRWDRESSQRVDSFAADSAHVARKLRRFWSRSARVIHPPVDLQRFTPGDEMPEGFFLVVAALVPYKKVDRAIRAANLTGQRLVVAGTGPEEARLRKMAGRTVQFAGGVTDQELCTLYRRARALIYPGVEDFGITALESQACGRPVLAFAGGGALETVVNGVTGRFFTRATAKSLARLMDSHQDSAYDPKAIRRHAETFSPEAFRAAAVDWIREEARFLG